MCIRLSWLQSLSLVVLCRHRDHEGLGFLAQKSGADPGFSKGGVLTLHSGADETTFVADTYVWLDTTPQIFPTLMHLIENIYHLLG